MPLVLAFVLIALGVGIFAAAAITHIRRHPGERLGRQTSLPSGWVRWAPVAGMVVATTGGVQAEKHIGWWSPVLVFSLCLIVGFLPRWLHNRRVDRRASELHPTS